MTVLALDPSSKAIGWAVADASGPICGAWQPLGWREKALPTDQRHREMCGRASHWLSDMITEHAPSVVVIEVGGGRMSDRCSERLRGALFAVLWIREIATMPVVPASWQAWAKRRMPAAFDVWKLDGKPDDQAAELMLSWFLATQRIEEAA